MHRITFCREDIFLMQEMYLDEDEKNKLRTACVGIVGLGGIGGYAAEAIVRNGTEHIRLADSDAFEAQNFRQLHMTTQTVGLDKTDVVSKRIREINPLCKIETYPSGTNAATAQQFFNGLTVVIQEADTLAAEVIANYWGDKLRVPIVHSSRTHWWRSRTMNVSIRDYRREDEHYVLDQDLLSKNWGVNKSTLQDLFESIERESDSQEIDRRLRAENNEYRRQKILDAVEHNDLQAIEGFTIGKGIEHASAIIKRHPEKYHKMRVAPEQVMVMGGLAVFAAKSIILDREWIPEFSNLG
ncbi:MAG: hypothetical protein GX562_05935 [Coriobacteriaceae bacterium]|nr:hypothetical protein [Coriobacteriaceae bacterium]